MNTLGTHDRIAALPGLSGCEVLVLAGDADRIIPYRHSEVIADALPTARLVRLPGVERLDLGYTDGFNIHPPSYPDGFDAITQRLIPALTSAGYYQPLPDEPVTFRSLFTTTDEPAIAAPLQGNTQT